MLIRDNGNFSVCPHRRPVFEHHKEYDCFLHDSSVGSCTAELCGNFETSVTSIENSKQMRTDPAEFLKFWDLLPEVARKDAWLIPLFCYGKAPAIPRGESWEDLKYRLTPEAAIRRLKKDANVGITFRGKALISDIDHIEKAKTYFCAGMVETLIVKTRDGKLHLYYINDGSIENCDLNNDGVHILEIRTRWRYVVCPGSYVAPTPGSGGDGLYRVVAFLPPKMISRKDLSWLNRPERKIDYAPVNFKGKYLGLPCIQLFFTLPLKDGRATRASKLLATAAVMDKVDDNELKNIDKQFADFQNSGNAKKLPYGGVVRWAKNIKKTRKRWNCGEQINFLRYLEIFPPCSGCPLKMGVK